MAMSLAELKTNAVLSSVSTKSMRSEGSIIVKAKATRKSNICNKLLRILHNRFTSFI
jgi:predicted nucleotidyltransferase